MPKSVDSLVAGVGLDFQKASKAITFTGAAGLGAVGTGTIFTVVGEVNIFHFSALCSVDVTSAGGGSISLGTTGNNAYYVAATVATTIDANEWWSTTTPTASIVNLPTNWALGNTVTTDDIIFTVTTAAVDGGTVSFYAYWRPLSADGMLS